MENEKAQKNSPIQEQKTPSGRWNHPQDYSTLQPNDTTLQGPEASQISTESQLKKKVFDQELLMKQIMDKIDRLEKLEAPHQAQ